MPGPTRPERVEARSPSDTALIVEPEFVGRYGRTFRLYRACRPPIGRELTVLLPSVGGMDGQDWIDGYRTRLAAVGARLDSVTRELAGITATASSRDGIASVGVDAAGGLRRVVFGGARRAAAGDRAGHGGAGGRAAGAGAGRAGGERGADATRVTERSPTARARPLDSTGSRW